MNCDQALEAISAALDGELSAKERTLLDAHLADCPTCAALFDELAGQSRLLRQLDCQVPEDLTARILSQLPEQITPARRFSPRRWQRWGTVAACAVLVFWAGLALPLRESNPANLEPMVNNTTVGYDMVGGPSPAQFSADGAATAQEAQPNTDSSSFKAGERMAGLLGDVHVLSIPDVEIGAPAAQVLTSVQAVDDCLNQYALPERAELLALYPADYFMDAALIAVSLESSSASVSYTVEDLRPTEDGYELMIRQSAPEEQAGGGAAWLLLVESYNSITPEDAITVILEET